MGRAGWGQVHEGSRRNFGNSLAPNLGLSNLSKGPARLGDPSPSFRIASRGRGGNETSRQIALSRYRPCLHREGTHPFLPCAGSSRNSTGDRAWSNTSRNLWREREKEREREGFNRVFRSRIFGGKIMYRSRDREARGNCRECSGLLLAKVRGNFLWMWIVMLIFLPLLLPFSKKFIKDPYSYSLNKKVRDFSNYYSEYMEYGWKIWFGKLDEIKGFINVGLSHKFLSFLWYEMNTPYPSLRKPRYSLFPKLWGFIYKILLEVFISDLNCLSWRKLFNNRDK